MRSKTEIMFIIDDDNLDQSGIETLSNLIGILEKLSNAELHAGLERDISLASDVIDLKEKCKQLKDRYSDRIDYK